jgi:hypothetical protein
MSALPFEQTDVLGHGDCIDLDAECLTITEA